jgi:golgi phosphoprotein 3
MSRSLRLHHELLLLALHDRKGTPAFGQMIHLGLGGAVLTELLLEERVRIVSEGGRRRKEYVEVVDTRRMHDLALDAALAKLSSAKRRATPQNTVSRIGGVKDLRHLVARDLCRMGILRETEQEILLLFRRRVYPTVDPAPERALVARVRAALEGSSSPDERTSALVAVADVTHTLAAIYDRRERKALKARIRAVRGADVGSRAARQAIEAAAAATTAAIVAANAAAAG